jgi:transcriptional regulator with XRE-family HTH domain
VSPKTVGTWEREDRKPPLDQLNKMADLFDVTTDYLLGRSDNPNDGEASVDIANPDAVLRFEGQKIDAADREIINDIYRRMRDGRTRGN